MSVGGQRKPVIKCAVGRESAGAQTACGRRCVNHEYEELRRQLVPSLPLRVPQQAVTRPACCKTRENACAVYEATARHTIPSPRRRPGRQTVAAE